MKNENMGRRFAFGELALLELGLCAFDDWDDCRNRANQILATPGFDKELEYSVADTKSVCPDY